jgi:hypothetical protein
MCSAQRSFPVTAHSSHPSALHLADPGISAINAEIMKAGEVKGACSRSITKRRVQPVRTK